MPELSRFDFISDDPDELLIRQGVSEGLDESDIGHDNPKRTELDQRYLKLALKEIADIEAEADRLADFVKDGAAGVLQILGKAAVYTKAGQRGLDTFETLIKKQQP